MSKAEIVRKIAPGVVHRSIDNVRAIVVDEAARTVELSFASDFPVTRYDWVEILRMSGMDMSRIGSGKAALLLEHDRSDQVGVVLSVTVGSDNVARAIVKFSRSVRGQEIFQDVVDGIRSLVSVGYRIHEVERVSTKDGVDTYEVTRWEPYEISIVSVPADPTVGVGRSADSVVEKPVTETTPAPAEEEARAEEEAADATETEAEASEPAGTVIEARSIEATPSTNFEVKKMDEIQKERKRAEEILAYGKDHQFEDAAREFVASGKSVDEFRTFILANKKASAPISALSDHIQFSEREAKQYSYARAIALQLDVMEGRSPSGFELEVAADIVKALPAGYQSRSGVFVPTSLKRAGVEEALTTVGPNKGSSTVFNQYGDLIELMRNTSVLMRLGARTLNGLQGPISFPKQTGAATAHWVGENSGSDVPGSNATYGSVGMAARTLMSTTAFTRQFLIQSSFDVEMAVREDLAAVGALARDVAGIHGSGVGFEPRGIYNHAEVQEIDCSDGVDFGKLVDMVTMLMQANTLRGNVSYLTTAGMAGKLAQTVVAPNTDTRMIWNGRLDDGTLNGYAATASNQVRSNMGVAGDEHGLIFGMWNDMLLGSWGAMELVIDPYSLKKQGLIEVTSFEMADVALRHGSSFVRAVGAKV